MIRAKKHLDPVYKVVAKSIRKKYNINSKTGEIDDGIRIYNLGSSENDKDIIYNSKLDKYIELEQKTYIIELCRSKPYLYKADKYFGFNMQTSYYKRKGLPFDLSKMRLSILQTIRDTCAIMCNSQEVRDTFKGHKIEILYRIFCLAALGFSIAIMLTQFITYIKWY